MKIILPLLVTIPRKTKADKVFALNLNIYRNSHHFTLAAAKILWKGIVETALKSCSLSKYDMCRQRGVQHSFTYTVFPVSGRKFDIANVCSIIDKFTCDALVEFGIITDDSYKVIPEVNYRFGAVDKENPRCELVIGPLKPDFSNLPF